MPLDPEEKTVIATAKDLQPLQKPDANSPASLIQYVGEKAGTRYPLNKEKMTVGRSDQADICISEASVSRLHATLWVEQGHMFLEDGKSVNGTFVNEKKILERVDLQDQDMVRLGTVLFKYFAPGNLDGLIHDKIYRTSTLDGGTGIYNKQFLLDSLESEWRKAKQSHLDLTILYYDLDHFKKVNDTYGHNAGDQVLRETAGVVKGLLRKNDIFCRFGGEEFVIVLPQTSIEGSKGLAEKIRSAVAMTEIPLSHNGQTILHRQTLSMGVAQLDATMASIPQLLEAADKKLYTSKTSGRNCITF
jgi:two-component system cell cycle response regulator